MERRLRHYGDEREGSEDQQVRRKRLVAMTTPLTTGPHKVFEGSDSITPYCPHDVLVSIVGVHGNVTSAIGCR